MVCLCSSLFFLGLYQFNNKYSQNTIQAANGILALSEEELQKSPVRFPRKKYGMKAIICATFPLESRPISPALQTLLPMAAGLIR